MPSSLLTDALSKVFGETCETDALEAAQGVLTLPFTLPVFTFILVCTHNTDMLVLSRSAHTTQTHLYCQGLHTLHRHACIVKVCTHNTDTLVKVCTHTLLSSGSAYTIQTCLYCQGLHTQHRHICIIKVCTCNKCICIVRVCAHNRPTCIMVCTHNADTLVSSKSAHTSQTCLYYQGLHTHHRNACIVKVCTHNIDTFGTLQSLLPL